MGWRMSNIVLTNEILRFLRGDSILLQESFLYYLTDPAPDLELPPQPSKTYR